MLPTGIWAHQVKVALDRAGKDYCFNGPSEAVGSLKDEFGQPTGDTLCVTIRGLFHEKARWTPVQVNEEGASNILRNHTEAYLLVEKEFVGALNWGMSVKVAGKTYKLIKSRDMAGLELFCDLVLEEVQGPGLQD